MELFGEAVGTVFLVATVTAILYAFYRLLKFGLHARDNDE